VSEVRRSKWGDQFLITRIAYILFHAGLVPHKKAPSPAYFKLLASMIIQQKYRSVIRDMLVKTIQKGYKVKVRQSNLRIIEAMLWIGIAMAFHGRHLEEAPPAIEEEPDSEEPPKNRSGEIIESIRILSVGGVLQKQ
jgi:hypothetical protein